MNIQIFGTKKSSDTRKAERWFKERGIKYQYIDLKQKGISRGELRAVISACGSVEALMDENAPDQQAVAHVKYIAQAQKEEALLERPQILRQPIVRNGRQAAVGYCPQVYGEWIEGSDQ